MTKLKEHKPSKIEALKAMTPADRRRAIFDGIMNNAMFIIIALVIIYVAIKNPRFLSIPSLVNIISLTAAKLPIALGVGGCIILAGTDISAGRQVGLAACISAGLQLTTNKLFPGLQILPIPVVLLCVLVACAMVGFVNGFFMAKFKLHPFIVTLSTQLIVYGLVLLFMQLGTNGGQTLSGMSEGYRNFIIKPLLTLKTSSGPVTVPRYVLYSTIITAIVWVIWNKTAFGKNMFAVGSNADAAKVSGVNVFWTTVMVHTLAGAMYGVTGFIEGARISSITQSAGLNYECDAIAACVIGGVSFVGGTGKISGIVLGVFVLRIIFVALSMLGIDPSMQYIIKGGIILAACSLDMRKYLAKK